MKKILIVTFALYLCLFSQKSYSEDLDETYIICSEQGNGARIHWEWLKINGEYVKIQGKWKKIYINNSPYAAYFEYFQMLGDSATDEYLLSLRHECQIKYDVHWSIQAANNRFSDWYQIGLSPEKMILARHFAMARYPIKVLFTLYVSDKKVCEVNSLVYATNEFTNFQERANNSRLGDFIPNSGYSFAHCL